MEKIKQQFIIFLFLFLNLPLYATQNPFEKYEDSLAILASQIIVPEHDFERLANNLTFKEYFEEILNEEDSFFYPFDSLRTVSIMKAPDESFRIISWYVPLQDHQFEYFGYVQSYNSRRGNYILYELTDVAGELDEPELETLNHGRWYGAVYMDLIHKRYRRNDYYILLGWRGDNPLTRKRVIEPIRVMGNGRPSFGRSVFRYKNNRYRRIIFEYSSRVSVSLKYERHSIPDSRRPVDLIIFDRLSPIHRFMQGNYQFYKPEANIFDGFYFDSGRWIFIEDVDARMPNRRPPPRPVPPR